MPKDDFFAIAYRILDYLYTCMREGRRVDPDPIMYDSKAINISQSYWNDIMIELYNNGYIKGVAVIKALNQPDQIKISDLSITLKGIEYLQDNSKMKKAAGCVKTVLEYLKEFI